VQLLGRGVARVYAAARDPRTVDVHDPRVVRMQLDVTDPASVARAAEVATGVEIVVNNAGIASATSCWNLTPRHCVASSRPTCSVRSR
jgi:NAD(P)-dependent dehydrogenase (short-subunit alcohol dehydrogenase family)